MGDTENMVYLMRQPIYGFSFKIRELKKKDFFFFFGYLNLLKKMKDNSNNIFLNDNNNNSCLFRFAKDKPYIPSIKFIFLMKLWQEVSII